MSGMVQSLRFRVLFYRLKKSGVDMPLGPELQLPGWPVFLRGKFAKLICSWFLMRWRVSSLNNRHVDMQCNCAKHELQQSMISMGDATVECLLHELLEHEPS